MAYRLSNNCTKNYYNRAINIRIMLKYIGSHAFWRHIVFKNGGQVQFVEVGGLRIECGAEFWYF